MKNGIKSAAAVESETQTLETDKAASAAHDVQKDDTDWLSNHAYLKVPWIDYLCIISLLCNSVLRRTGALNL